ncbi:TonB-dependent receptor [Massilia jejuensis]|uniref:TonB-dependent receptor n=1 Tax=Massilia jejuensis TaxID=648894 RepID=A0ABW0PLU3_9BURK
MLQPTRLSLLIALALQTLSATAAAQSVAGSGDTPPQTVQVIGTRAATSSYNEPNATSATRIDAPLRDVPQTVNVIPAQVMRDQAAQSMESVLRFVPGVGLSHGDGQRDQVTLRGFTAISDQYIDGLRDDALYFRDLSNIEQVEVVKGPASVLYGRGSSGGLINRITKKPGIDKSELTAQAGSWRQRRVEADLARVDKDSGLAFRVTGAVERADSYRDPQLLDRKAIALSLQARLGANTSLLLQAEYLNDRRVTDFGVPSYRGRPVDVDPGTYYGAANAADVDTSEATVKAIGFTLQHKFGETLGLRNAYRRYDYTLARFNTLVTAVNESALTASLSRTQLRRAETGWFNQTELAHTFSTGGMKHQFLYGVEFGQQDKDQVNRTKAGVATIALFNPVLPVLARDVPVAPTADNIGIVKTASAYVQDLVTLSPQWKALAGLRYDRFNQRTVERRAGQASLDRTDHARSPRVGLVYQPSAAQSWYASFSKSFQPSGEAFPLAANNAQIAPEETTNREVGGKFDVLDGVLSAGASLFRLERTNIKTTDPATNRLVPIGTQRTDGLELTLTGQLADGWRIWSGYALLDARVTSSPAVDNSDNVVKGVRVQGKRATLTPRHSANLWLVKELGQGLRAGAGLTYVGDRFANPGNTVVLPGFATVDAMVGGRLGQFDVQLNLRNLFDKRYVVSGHGTAPNLNLPGAPRSAQLTARYAF